MQRAIGHLAGVGAARWAVAVLAATGLLGGPATSGAGEIRWRSGAVESAAKSPAQLRESIAALLAEPAAAGGDRRHVVVQFDEPVGPQRRATLQASGLTLLNYLGDNAFFASVSTSAVEAETVSRTPGLIDVQPVRRAWKLHPSLATGGIPPWSVVSPAAEGGGRDSVGVAAYVLFHADVAVRPDGVAICHRHGAVVRAHLRTVNGLVIELPRGRIEALADEDLVAWIEPPLPRMSEVNDSNRAITGADMVQEPPYGLDGSGVTVLVYDGATALASHPDFGGRLHIRDDSGLHDHPTHVSGTIGGDGTVSGGLYRGMAPGVTIESYGFQFDGSGIFLYTNPGDIESDYDEAINVYGADIANNSIGTNACANLLGCDITGDYGVTSAVIDAIVRGGLGAPFRVVWANGNERGCDICCLVSPGGYHSTAPPAGAKNHITVGALNSNDDSLTSFTSWGPTDDGRLKPDVSAPGCQSDGDGGVTSCSKNGGYLTFCGTSMATPTVTGLSALLLQDFRVHFPGRPDFRNSTLKALLAHNAKDIESPGPDYRSGYGSVRIRPTIDFMRTGSFQEAQVGQGESHVLSLVVIQGDAQLVVTLAWDDVPGTPNVDPALVNDLDLRVYDPFSQRHYPWTLDPADPGAPATQIRADHLNNIEQVTVNDPGPGIWRIEVYGYNVPQGPQPFSLCFSPSLDRDCDNNGVPDAQQIADNPALDCSGNGILDVCEPDCNGTDQADSCDILDGVSEDCDANGIPDECEPFRDCNGNDVHDPCDIREAFSLDCNGNGVPDECISEEMDCNGNLIPDACDLGGGASKDCNLNAVPDECDIAAGGSLDCLPNGIPDECELGESDCNGNGIPDACDIAGGTSADNDSDGLADECTADVLFVDADASGLNHGTNWTDAYNGLQSALTIAANPANAVSQIWVAAGRYTPALPGGDRGATFILAGGVGLYGGFAGTEINLSQRDPSANVSILSGDLNNNDAPDFGNRDDNSYRVVTAIRVTNATVIDGFTITGGNTSEDACAVFAGGGLYVERASPTIGNCIFIRNFATFGGGMYIEVGSPTVTDCRFVENTAAQHGGGLASANLGSLLGSPLILGRSGPLLGGGPFFDDGGDPIVRNCTFLDNTAKEGGAMWFGGGEPTLFNCILTSNTASSGGGINNWGADLTLINCSFIRNRAAVGGGGMLNAFAANPTLFNCTFLANRADMGGGMRNGDILAEVSRPALVNCVFSGNRALTDGGGIHNGGNSVVTVTNCTLYGNRASGRGGGIYNNNGAGLRISNAILWANRDGDGLDEPAQIHNDIGAPAIGYSCIQGLTGDFGGIGNIGADPLLVNPKGIDDVAGTQDDNVTIAARSPCLDAGDNTAVPADTADLDGDGDRDEPIPLDPLGKPRFFDDSFTEDSGVGDPPVVDMGAFEGADCNGNGISDELEIALRMAEDCDHNGMPDECDFANGTVEDCNDNLIPDACEDDCNCNNISDAIDIITGTSEDCTTNGIPDECEPDCNSNGVADSCDIADGRSEDCNDNGAPDECDIADGTSEDCNINLIPDECDSGSGTSGDCNGNGILDDCEDNDCNGNGLLDACDLADGTSLDCNENGVPDECDIARSNATGSDRCVDAEPVCPGKAYRGTTAGMTRDGCSECACLDVDADVWYSYTPAYDGVATIDLCESPSDTVLSVHTSCEVTLGRELICSDNACGVRSAVTLRVIGDRTYYIRIAAGSFPWTVNFKMNLAGPECALLDCNGNLVPDECDLSSGASLDAFPSGGDGIPDECQGDCNSNLVPDVDDIADGRSEDCNRNFIPDECDIGQGVSSDCNGNGVPDDCELQLQVLTSGDINAGFIAGIEAAGDFVTRVAADSFPRDLSRYDVIVLGLGGIRRQRDFIDRIDSFVGMGGGLILIHNLPNDSNFYGRASPIHDAGGADIRSGTHVVDDMSPLVAGLTGPSTLVGESVFLTLKPSAAVSINWTEDDVPMAATYSHGRGRVVYFNDLWISQNDLAWEGDFSYGTALTRNALDYVGVPRNDCNLNGLPDDCEIERGESSDHLPVGGDGIPDECQIDCNSNQVPDLADIVNRTSTDCNGNLVPDECDISNGSSLDCNFDLIPDECETGIDILVGGHVSPGFVAGLEAAGHFVTATGFERFPFRNLSPYDVIVVALNERDEPLFCYNQIDEFVGSGGGLIIVQSKPWFPSALCDASPVMGVQGFVQRSGTEVVDPVNMLVSGLDPLSSLTSLSTMPRVKANATVVARWIEDGAPMAVTSRYGLGRVAYFNVSSALVENWSGDLEYGTSLMLNALDFVVGNSQDCNLNRIPDECDIANRASLDTLPLGGDGIPDECQADCNGNLVPDSVDIISGLSEDCDENWRPDECEADCNHNGIVDGCDILGDTSLDCNGNGVIDLCEISEGVSRDCQANAVPDECDIESGMSADENGNGIPDECDECTDHSTCNDGNVCTYDRCSEGRCLNTAVTYADVTGDGVVDVFDLFCVLNAFGGTCPPESACSCGSADLAPCPNGDGRIDIFDLFALLSAFRGEIGCECAGGAAAFGSR